MELTKRQKEIIEASMKLIGEGGIQSLTIKNLSSEIGVSESAIYRHFSSKTEVLSTLLDFLTSIVHAHYKEVEEMEGNSFEKIQKMISGQLKIFSDNPHYAIVILSDGLFKYENSLHEKIKGITHNARKTFLKVIEEGTAKGEIRNDVPCDQIAFVIMGSVRLTVTQWSISGFAFDLIERGKILLNTITTLIQK